MAYCALRDKSRFIKDVKTWGAGKSLRQDEIDSCETYADAIIEGRLGKSWATGSVPKLIEHIADLLGSSKAYKFLLSGQSPDEIEFPKSLQDEAFELLHQIANGEIGLKLPDGTWDEDFPGTENSEEKERRGIEIIL